MNKSKTEASEPIFALAERRAFMKLPLEERRRQLAKQASQMTQYYEAPIETLEREEWQGGDIAECSESRSEAR